LGIIFAANKVSAAAEKHGFTERDEEILSLFAAHAAIALTNARLYERSRELSVVQERSRLARDLHDAVIDGLTPPDLEAAGLAESLRRYAVLAGRAHGVPVTFTAACLPPLRQNAEAALYRVAQEALHNALRHAGASCVTVALSTTPRLVVLEVSDDGHGFAPEAQS